MPIGNPISPNEVRPILSKLDRWSGEADEADDYALSEHVSNAYKSLHEARTLLVERNRKAKQDAKK